PRRRPAGVHLLLPRPGSNGRQKSITRLIFQRRTAMASTKTLSLRTMLALGLVLSLIGSSFAGWRVSASRAVSAPGGRSDGLAGVLNPDGMLQAGARGSYETSGYRMELTATGAPRFVPLSPLACGTPDWDAQFSLNGANGVVNALAV